MTDLAAALLKDVPRYRFVKLSRSVLFQHDEGDWLPRDAVLAALSRALDPALAERAAALTKVGFGYDLTDEDKAAITALLTANAALRAERDALAKAHEKEVYVWSENYAGLERKLSDAEAVAEKLQAECQKLGREVNMARYGQPDFAWSIHKQAMAELQARAEAAEAEVEKLREVERAARKLEENLGVDGVNVGSLRVDLYRALAAALTQKEPTNGE